MFGVGLAFQIAAAERRGVSFAPRFWRRTLGLIVLGFLHVAFGFIGDILIIYGLVGILLYWMRNKTPKSLNRWAWALIIIQCVLVLLAALSFWLLGAYEPETMMEIQAQMLAETGPSIAIYQNGGLFEIMVQRLKEWTEYFIYTIFLQIFSVLAYFLIGLSLTKQGIINNAAHPFWSKSRRFYFPIGMALNILAAYLISQSETALNGQFFFAVTLIIIGAPLASFGYAGWLAKWSEGPMTPLKEFVARGGTASLTAYLMQSLILSLIFCGYGLGLYAKIGAAGCIAIAFVTGLFTISFSSLWRKKYKRGPMEWLLRKWTYMGAR